MGTNSDNTSNIIRPSLRERRNNATSLIKTHFKFDGWRKKCLYFVFFTLILGIVVNVGLTIWIIKVLELDVSGVSQINFLKSGVELSGNILIMDLLRTSAIRAGQDHPIKFESQKNMAIQIVDGKTIENKLDIGNHNLQIVSDEFHVEDINGNLVFSVNSEEISFLNGPMTIENDVGIIFHESLEFQRAETAIGKDMSLESPLGSINMKADEDIEIEANAGSLDVVSAMDMQVQSSSKTIHFNASEILFPNLQISNATPTWDIIDQHFYIKAYQICTCANGKIFMISPKYDCFINDENICA